MDGDSLYRGGRCFQFGEAATYDRAACLHRDAAAKPTPLIVGDSHGADLWPGFARYRNHFKVIQATRTGCQRVLLSAHHDPVCDRFFDDILHKDFVRHPPTIVVLAASGFAALRRTLVDAAFRAVHPVLIGPLPQYLTELPRLLVSAHSAADPELSARYLNTELFQTDRELEAVVKAAGVPYLSAVSALCDDRICSTLVALPVPLKFDYGHFTGLGSEYFVNLVLPQIASAYDAALGGPITQATH